MSAPEQLRRTVIGALLAALVAVAVVVLWSSRASTYEVHAVFDTANGLVRTGEVRVGGFRVGTIAGIDLGDDGYPHVTMEIDEDYRLRRGASADIRLVSQAGQLNRYVALTNGRGAPLSDGATLGLARTDQPVELDELLSALSPDVRDDTRRTIANALRAFDGRGPDIDRGLRYSGAALGETAELLADITADREALRRLVDRAEDGARAVAAQPVALERTVAQLAQALSTVAGRNAELAQSLALLPETARETRLALARFDDAIPVLRRVTSATEAVLAPLGPFARELRRTVEGPAPRAFDATLALIRSFPRSAPGTLRLIRGALPSVAAAGPTLELLNPILDHLRARAPDALGWIPLFGDVAANYDAAGHGARVLATLTDPPRRLTADDSCQAGWLARPFDRPPGTLECEPWRDFADSFVGGGKPVDAYMTAEERRVRDGGLGR